MSSLKTTEIYRKKILLVGDPAVGKTSLIRRFVQDKFDDKYISTIGTKISKKNIVITHGPQRYNLSMMIWDTMGQRGYQRVLERTINGASGVILVCDLTRRKTLNGLETYWIETIDSLIADLPMVIFGNKADLTAEHEFGAEELVGVLEPHGFPFYITSARTGKHVNDAFYELGRLMLEPEFEPLEADQADQAEEGDELKTTAPAGTSDAKAAASARTTATARGATAPKRRGRRKTKARKSGVAPTTKTSSKAKAPLRSRSRSRSKPSSKSKATTKGQGPKNGAIRESYTLREATDALMDDIYNQYGASDFSMAMVKHQFSRVGFDTDDPNYKKLHQIVDHLTEIDGRLFPESMVRKNRVRRLSILNKIDTK